MPNNREWAILFWLAAVLVWALLKKETRAGLLGVFRAFATPKVLIPLGLLIGYVCLEAWAGSLLSLWSWDLLKETVIWFLVTGFALFLNFDGVAKECHYFRKRIAAATGFVVFIEFFTNLFVFSLLAELLLQPFLVMRAGMQAVAAGQSRLRPVKRLTMGLGVVVVVALLAFNVQQLIVNWNDLDGQAILLQFTLPIWMTVGLLPFIYMLSLVSNYELAFKWIGFRNQGTRWSRARARLALVIGLHLRTKVVRRFNLYWGREIATAPSFRAAWAVVSNFRQSEKARKESEEAGERAAADEQERLKRYAGVDGMDEDGRQLDRREFKETTDALRWLATCQMGWHRNQGGRYRKRLIAVMDSEQGRRGLPEDHGITMQVREDGQAWYAWRRTVSGWCFAIGAAGPPPDQWEYDGPEPPYGFPGEDPAWGDGQFSYREGGNW